MGRYIKDISLRQPIDVVSMIMEDYVYHNRFRRTDWNGEMVFGMQDSHNQERYLKWSYAAGVFHLEAWLKGPLGGEIDLDGIGGGSSKQEFKESLEQVIEVLKRQSAQSVSSGHVGSDPLHHTDNYAAEHQRQQSQRQQSQTQQNQTQQNQRQENQGQQNQRQEGRRQQQGMQRSSGNTAIILAVLAFLFSSIPVFGILLAILGLRRLKGEQGSTQRIGRTLCILAIVFSIVTIFTTMIPLLFLPFYKLY